MTIRMKQRSSLNYKPTKYEETNLRATKKLHYKSVTNEKSWKSNNTPWQHCWKQREEITTIHSQEKIHPVGSNKARVIQNPQAPYVPVDYPNLSN